MSTNKKILVYADTPYSDTPLKLGVLESTHVRGKEIFAFEYSKEWLKSRYKFAIDPSLQLYSGKYYNENDKVNFGIFTDSAPDRWGRVLMQRREAILAKEAGRKSNSLSESDYLLGVFDEVRMGALRFKLEGGKNFLNADKALATPPFASLRELQNACLHIEDEDQSESLKWLNMLLAPGSSLGGARPKANVVDTEGNLWIAKFPSKNDDADIEAWEMVANDLATCLGLNIPETQLKKFGRAKHTFLTKRFDREGKNRVHFASAMTLLGYSDGDNAGSGASYLELAEFITRNGIESDLRELWTRIVFNICIGNTDDHLRNHGFLLRGDKWKLSPVYDINPNPYAKGLSLNIDEHSNDLDLDLAMSVHKHFRISKSYAKDTLKDFANLISDRWNIYADDYRISSSQKERYSDAFTAAHDYADRHPSW